MSKEKIVALVYYGIRVKGNNPKIAKKVLKEKIEKVKLEPLITITDEKFGEFEFEEELEYNKNLPEDAPEDDLIYVQQLQLEVKAESYLDYVNFIFRNNPDGNMIEEPSKVTLDIQELNSFNATIQSVYNNLLRQNKFMVDELRKLKPELFKPANEVKQKLPTSKISPAKPKKDKI